MSSCVPRVQTSTTNVAYDNANQQIRNGQYTTLEPQQMVGQSISFGEASCKPPLSSVFGAWFWMHSPPI